ncbi:hypothetical protein ISX56_33275, partial [Serratia ureilytica]|nr:hypothetical protein [Serratia ureilytica]
MVDERSGSLRAGVAWWENFNDPQLSSLIDGVLIANQDLALAITVIALAYAVFNDPQEINGTLDAAQ